MKRAKKILSVILALGMISTMCVYSSSAEITPKADIDSNLTAHWNFEETDASGNPVNIGSDSSIKAVLEGNKVSVKDSGDETYGKVLHFEPKGDAAENSRMFIGDMFNPKQEDFSVSLWVNNSSQQVTNQNTIILQFADKDGATGKTFMYRSPEDKYTVYMNGTGIVTSPATSDGKWENITITKENLDNGKYTLKFYINGEQTYTGECDASQVIDKVTDLIIGSHKNKTDKDNGQFTGDIDDLRFYERALTADDVKALYNAKADDAVNSQLEAAISQADSLLKSGKLETTHQAYVLLDNSLKKAKAALETGTTEEKQNAISDLNEKIADFNTAVDGEDALNKGLVGYWTADSGSLENMAQGGTLTATMSGSNLTIAESDIESMGKMLSFAKKTSGNSSNVTISNGLNSQNEFTITMWVKNSEAQKDTTMSTVLIQQSTATGRSLLFRTTSGQYGTYISEENKYFGETTSYNEWQHLALVKSNGTDGNYTIALYLDGVKLGEHTLSKNNATAVTDLIIGSHKQLGNSDQFAGRMDEIRLYTRALSENEVKGIYQLNSAAVNEQKLVALKLQYNELLTKAKEALASGDLTEDMPEYIALKEAVDHSAEIPENIIYEDMLAEYEALSTAYDNYQNASPIVVTINTDDVTNIIDNGVFGINHRFGFNGYGTFDSETMTMKQDFVDLYKEAGFGSVRYPGGSISNLFQWKGTLGDKDERLDQVHGYYNTNSNGKPQRGIAANFGIKEIGDFASDVGSEIVYVYGMGRGSANDAADLVEYLNAPNDGSNPNGGIDWAAVRAENGHPDPYNVRYFEMGNEMNQGGGKDGDGLWSQGFWTNYVNGKASDYAYIEGGTVVCEKQYAVAYDDWNSIESKSDGTANQIFYMRYANPHPALGIANGDIGLRDITSGNSGVMEQYNYDPADYADFKAISSNDETTKVYVGNEEWKVVSDLSTAGANDKVAKIDYATGEIIFGDGVNGAIPPKDSQIFVSYTVEREGFIDISQAMRDTMEQINNNLKSKGEEEKELYIYTSWETSSFINIMHQKGADSLYDGMTIHPYAGTPAGGSSNEETKKQFYYSTLSLIPGTVSRVSNLVNEMRTITGDNTKVPAISEYGIYPSYDTMVRSQTHALYIARVLMEYIRLDSPYIQKHCLVDWYSSGGDSLGPTQQAVIQAVPQEGADIITGEGDYKFFSTPSARVFEMYNSASGTDVLSSTFSDTRLLDNGTEQYAAMASKDADGNVYLALVNSKLEGKGVVDIKVDGVDLSGKTLEIQYISGDTFYAENTIDNPDNVDVIRTTDTVAENSETARVVVEPHSFTIVKVVNALAEEPDTPDVTELKNKVEEALPMIDMEEYTAESREVLKTAIDEAQAIIAKAEAGEEVTQTQVDEALKAIESAVNSLELVKPDFVLGDADGSGSMTIDDASYIQQYLVKAISADKFVFEAADTNKDGKITVYDATKIQLAIASNEDL